MHRWLSPFAIALASALTFNACGGDGSSPTSPTRTPDPASHPASLSGTMAVNGAQTDAGGYKYTSDIRLTEGGGTAATITGVTLSFLKGGNAYAATDPWGSEAWVSNNNVIGANGTLTSKSLTVTHAQPDRYADQIEARITYTDGTSGSNAITVRATVPALPAPPAASKFTLTGTVRDASSGSTIRDARIEVEDGASAGRNTKTDGSGRYSLADLNPGSFTVRASKTGYASSDLAVLDSNTTLNFTLRKSGGSGSGGGDDGGGDNGDGGGGDDGGGGSGGGGSSLTCSGRSVPSVVNCPNNQGRKAPTLECNDGSFSCAATTQGACSHHKGIKCHVCPGVLCGSATATDSSNIQTVPEWLLPAGPPQPLQATIQ